MKQIPFSKISVVGNERRYTEEAIEGGHLSGDGAFCRKCESILSERLGGAIVLMTNSGTSALDLGASILGLSEGDEVIMPSFTFVSTANAVCRLGAVPKFVDVSPETMNIDIEKVAEAITPGTKAIFPVHYAGVGAEPSGIEQLARAHDLVVFEDAAQGVGASYEGKPLGTFGAMAAFSFHEQKNIGCGEGGALVINDEQFLDWAYIVRDKGTNRRAFFSGLASFYSWVGVGASYVMPDLSAAFLLGQLEKADRITRERLRIQSAYHERLDILEKEGFIELQKSAPGAQSNGHITFFFTNTPEIRGTLLEHLGDRGIRALFHYVPLHSSPFGQSLGYQAEDLPVTENRSARLVRLPMYLGLSVAEIDRICEEVSGFFRGKIS